MLAVIGQMIIIGICLVAVWPLWLFGIFSSSFALMLTGLVLSVSTVLSGVCDDDSAGKPLPNELAMRRVYGPVNAEVVCLHCQSRGFVRTKTGRRKFGISGAKATGAVLTGRLWILVTGLSHTELVTDAHCSKCGIGWTI
jgi:hypothetical protein